MHYHTRILIWFCLLRNWPLTWGIYCHRQVSAVVVENLSKIHHHRIKRRIHFQNHRRVLLGSDRQMTYTRLFFSWHLIFFQCPFWPQYYVACNRFDQAVFLLSQGYYLVSMRMTGTKCFICALQASYYFSAPDLDYSYFPVYVFWLAWPQSLFSVWLLQMALIPCPSKISRFLEDSSFQHFCSKLWTFQICVELH